MAENKAFAADREMLELAEQVIRQTHYDGLDRLPVCPLPESLLGIRPEDVTCLFRLRELVFSRAEGSLIPLTTVLNALHMCGASCLVLLQFQEGQSELYIGAVNKQRYDNVYYLNTVREVLRGGIEGNLPGTELEELVTRRQIRQKLTQCLDNGFDSQCITAVSCVAGDWPRESGSPQGIERLLEAIGNKNFSLLILADPVDARSMEEVRRGYEELSSQLAAMEQTALSYQTGQSTTLSEGYSESFSKSIGTNLSMTQSQSTSTGWSRAVEDKEHPMSQLVSMGAGILTKSYLAANAMSNLLGINQGSVNESQQESQSTQYGHSQSQQQGQQVTAGSSVASSTGTTYSYTLHDRHIKSLLDRIEWYLQWLNQRENYGMFRCCAYIVSSGAGTNQMVASQYQALLQGRREISQPVAFNTWTRENGVEGVRQYLLHLTHPELRYKKMEQTFSPSMLLSSMELSRQLALPQRSTLGVSIMEYASFGREVVRKAPLRAGRVLRVGSIFHMGKALPNQPVLLDMQSLAAHTFVAGTNGSGKSNTVFRILEELLDAQLPFLVIEPAKGEYKNVFGNRPDVQVYGTNRTKTPLLYLNPFWFNQDVAVLEHIDKLVEIFNASWSMYAAMPAVLKAAIENAYIACGWDLTASVCCRPRPVFPTVRDVLAEFNNKMDSTAFSREVKGNYVGALSTRMESLCNGIYGELFGGDNLTDQQLFGSNVIIDLSRVGSIETKAMIMGVLLVRLQEYRMATEAMNLPLQHITVLEEAHHLLRRTSSVQSDEGSNLLGKSVEMISNAIAEMRSYGEGFIIVDQSPGLLDLSVMRNTNTKLILRLPEGGDRELVGNTMGLTAEQIYELSRLKTGVCAIYQKDWLQAVLCQVDLARHKEQRYIRPAAEPEGAADQTMQEGSSHRADRGVAWSRLCPLQGRQPPFVEEQMLRQAAERLEQRGGDDRQLAQLLESCLDSGQSRCRGELHPYVDILWQQMEEENGWKILAPLLERKEFAAWDQAARRQLERVIETDPDTQTSLLSLYLQRKGALAPVRAFYYPWYRMATAKNGALRTKNAKD